MSTPPRSNSRCWGRRGSRLLGNYVPRSDGRCWWLTRRWPKSGASRPGASAGCKCGQSRTAWPPCRPTSRPPKLPGCTRCWTSTPAAPDPLVMGGVWKRAVRTPWLIWS
jgi:hypothetical protein